MSDDIIKRSDAIDAIELVTWYHQNRNKDMVSGANSDEHQAWYKADDVYKALEAVPSADRPQGYWATRDKCEFRCSNCGKIIYADCENERNFCPCCGSKNRINMLLKWDDMPLKGADDERSR